MKTLYTDAGYRWQDTDTVEDGGVVTGRICVADDEGFSRIEIAGCGKIPKLKQYINIFELVAIARAIEIALEKGWTGSLAIYSDSKVATIWASSGKVGKKIETEAHKNALEYLSNVRKMYRGVVTYNHVYRDKNPAGKLLEIELEKDKKAREDAETNEEGGTGRGGIEIGSECDCGCHHSPHSDSHMRLHGCDVCSPMHV